MAGEDQPDRRGRSRYKKQLWPCSAREAAKEEEELTLTPHHTPSQSFDFIVWDRAYLDSIPAAAPSHVDPCEEQLALIHRPPARCSADAIADIAVAAGTPSLHDPVLLSCRTNADLPACLCSSKPRTSDGGHGLTSLEAAVRRHARAHPFNLAAMALPGARPSHCSADLQLHLKQLNPHHHHHHHQVSLMRSLSQPGLDSADSAQEAATIHSRREISHGDQGHISASAPAPLRRQARVFCFPASPGRRIKQAGNLTSRTDGQLWQAAGIPESIPNLQQQQKLMISRPGDDRHLQERKSVLTTQRDGKHHTPSLEAAACRRPIIGRAKPILEDLDRGYSSSSEMSSLCSNNHDHHHHHQAAAAGDSMRLKLKLWRVHSRVKAFCKKLCSAF